MSVATNFKNYSRDAVGLLLDNLNPRLPVSEPVRLGNLSRLIPIVERNIAANIKAVNEWRRDLPRAAPFWRDEAVVDFMRKHEATLTALAEARVLLGLPVASTA